MEKPPHTANEKLSWPWPLIISRTFTLNSPSQLPLFLYKRTLFSFILWTTCGFPVCIPKLQFICYFQINSFCWKKKITGYLIFQNNITRYQKRNAKETVGMELTPRTVCSTTWVPCNLCFHESPVSVFIKLLSKSPILFKRGKMCDAPRLDLDQLLESRASHS